MTQEHGAPAGVRFSATALKTFIRGVLTAVGVPEEDAEIVAHVLTEADLTGRQTHGISRLPMYVARLRQGAMNPTPELRWEEPTFPLVRVLDGDNGLGPVVAWRAMEEAVALSREHGLGCVAVRHSNHAGAMSAYCEAAAVQGQILLALTNSPPGIPPWGGRRAFLGTNPIAVAFPRGRGAAPLVIDLATSVVARGHIIEAARQGEPIPEGWAIDAEGRPTTDPQAALKGAVLPMAGPKGYALALMVEVFSGVLSGAGVGPGVANPYEAGSGPSNVGHFFWALNPRGFGDDSVFYGTLAALETQLREVPPMPGHTVRLPGDRAETERQTQSAQGIPLDPALVGVLNALASECHAPLLEAE
ncbi:MAG: Ldh family oxidoreductase [Firmicutes bacterium]|nr:Ldh family oxidoreductase [Bacillota bacterium]